MGTNAYMIEIDAPPAKVFNWIYERDRNLQWLPNLVEAVVVSAQPGGLGSTFRQVYLENGRRIEMTGTVTGYEQDRYLACDLQGPAFDLHVDYRLDDLGGRTRVSQSSEIVFTSFVMKLIGALLKPMMRKMALKQNESAFGKLKQLVEADRT